MTELSQTILAHYQVRKTKKQKLRFIALLQQHFPQLQVQEGGFPKSRNLVLGDISTAKVVLTAHYDTCAQLPVPNFIAPKSPVLCVLYACLLMLPIFAAVFLFNLLLNLFTSSYWVHYWLSLATSLLLVSLLFLGPACKHTANDNTSGVITLCELLLTLTPQLREKTAFVFFDHEENGLIGSSHFRSRYKKQMQDKLLINFDCVSDGDHILVAASKAARTQHGHMLDAAFQPTETKSIVQAALEKIYYPSDQAGFHNAVAIAAMKRRPIIGYYLDKIHTAKDTNFDKTNIKLLCDCILRFLKQI